MFKPQLSPQAKATFQKVLTLPEQNGMLTGGLKIGTDVNWGPGWIFGRGGCRQDEEEGHTGMGRFAKSVLDRLSAGPSQSA